MTDQLEEGTYVWENSGIQANFTAWGEAQPSGETDPQDCVAATPQHYYFWSDEDCAGARNLPVCTTNPRLNPCPGPQWVEKTLPNGDLRCYYVTTKGSPWHKGNLECQGVAPGAYMANMATPEEHNIVYEVTEEFHSHNSYIWFGLSDEAEEGTFVWETDGAVASYDRFTSGFGSDEASDCVAMYYGEWRDRDCTFNYRHVCEVDPATAGETV